MCASKSKISWPAQSALFLVFSLLNDTPHTSSDYQISHNALPGTSAEGQYEPPESCTTFGRSLTLSGLGVLINTSESSAKLMLWDPNPHTSLG